MQNNESTIQESLQRSPGESFPVLNLTTILENFTQSYAIASQTNAQIETSRLFRNLLLKAGGQLDIQPIALYRNRLARIRASIPLESDLTVAGSPAIVYHGTNSPSAANIRRKGFRVASKKYIGIAGNTLSVPYDSFGYHFGSFIQADERADTVNDELGGGMDTIAAVLYVKNPLRMRDLGDDWGTDKLLNALTIKRTA